MTITKRPHGYFGVGIYHTKNVLNVGTLWRSAYNFGASFIFTIGHRYKAQASDTLNTPKHIPLYQYTTFEEFQVARASGAQLIAIEQSMGSMNLASFTHPQQAIYLLSAEDDGIPGRILEKCQAVVHIDTPMCVNVAVAGSIVMYDRQAKGAR